MKKIVIVHYNTPSLLDALIKSINLKMENTLIYIFDNSDKKPFNNEYDNVIIIDNTKGQYINFDEWLEKYPNRNLSFGKNNGWGSAKHAYSIEKCIEFIDDDFVLLDSDVLIKKDFSELYDNKMLYVGETIFQPNQITKRVVPFLMYVNSKKFKENNVHYFDENYMHGLRVTKKSDSYDTGASLFINGSNYPHREIDTNDYIVHYKGGSWGGGNAKDKIAKKNMNEEQWLKMHSDLWGGEKNKKVVYTCITGNYDTLQEPLTISDGFDYICFTDNPQKTNSIWQMKPLPKDVSDLVQVKKQRCIKINAHKYLSEYDLSIWVDGKVLLKDDLNTFVDKYLKKDINIYVPKHPFRDCIYSEGAICAKMKKDAPERIKAQLKGYEKDGFPKKYGLLQSNIMLRKHNEPDCIKLMECWWNELKEKSHRDQLSFNYASWKNKDVKFIYMDKMIYKSQWFLWDGKHKKYNPTKENIPLQNEIKVIEKKVEEKPSESKNKIESNNKPKVIAKPILIKRRSKIHSLLKTFLK